MSRNHVKIDRKRWRGVRLRILDRDGWRCLDCGRAGKLEVDHKQPLQFGGDVYESDNLQTLCRTCHISKTRVENRRPDAARDAWQQLVNDRLNNEC